jgi:hypothetical protein
MTAGMLRDDDPLKPLYLEAIMFGLARNASAAVDRPWKPDLQIFRVTLRCDAGHRS